MTEEYLSLEASIITTGNSNKIALGVGPDVEIPVRTMNEIAKFSDDLASLVASWRAEQRYDTQDTYRRALADTVVEIVKAAIAIHNARAAELFPDDVLVAGEWTIQITKEETSPDLLRAKFEVQVKSLLADLINGFAEASMQALIAVPKPGAVEAALDLELPDAKF